MEFHPEHLDRRKLVELARSAWRFCVVTPAPAFRLWYCDMSYLRLTLGSREKYVLDEKSGVEPKYELNEWKLSPERAEVCNCNYSYSIH
ncbi:MAG: hypothetical protein K2L39_00135 [Muribaculaceae bacterium]|nr:hypothetical protein [Muribaculaceae bacterium]MDE6359623.1 hypothetical protein [Muribaculaceae bacterium]